MHILVTGGAGYIGSVLVPALVKEGHRVTVMDNLTFGNNLKGKNGFTLIERDVLDMDPDVLDGVDVVIHLAGLSNDPMANFRPRDNYIQNTAMTGLVVYLCKQKKVRRLIFGSTCSIYGVSSSIDDNEEAQVSPSFPYGISKVQCEHAINMAADKNFRPVILRQATVFGWAPRMRFDLVVNTMTRYGVCTGKIVISSPKLWRPLVHVRDLVEAYLKIVKMPETVSGTFNILSKNYTILDIGQEVQAALKEKGVSCELELLDMPDPRSYRLNGTKAREVLGFAPKIDIRQGVHEILEKVGDAKQPAWTNPWFINAEVYRKKILAEESTHKLWWKFLAEFKGEFDHLHAMHWPQEGP